MKSRLAILALLMVCASVGALLITVGAGITKADSVVTGDLSFLCRGTCNATDTTSPIDGILTYDHHDLTLSFTWDNAVWGFDLGAFSKDYFQSLTGKSDYQTVWVAECLVGSGDLPGHCGDNGTYVYLFQVKGCLDAACTIFTPHATTRDQIDFTSATAVFGDLAPDGASGTMTANVFKSHALNSADIVSTPEPSVLWLLLSGSALLRRQKTPRR